MGIGRARREGKKLGRPRVEVDTAAVVFPPRAPHIPAPSAGASPAAATGTVSRVLFDADLSIAKTAVFDEVSVVFTLLVANAGPEEALDVVVTDSLPAGLAYVSDDCGGSDVPPWTWNIGTLPAGEDVSCNITTLPAFEGTFANTANVTSAFVQDPEPDNDSDEVMVVVDFPDPLATFAAEKEFTDLLRSKTDRPEAVLLAVQGFGVVGGGEDRL